jgi:Fe-S-cluster containining protein
MASVIRPELPPCNECGVCCTSPHGYGRGGYVVITALDYVRLPGRYQLRVISESSPNVDRFALTESGRCVALRGEPGVKTSCDIYADRPSVCRSYERGSSDCYRERALFK